MIFSMLETNTVGRLMINIISNQLAIGKLSIPYRKGIFQNSLISDVQFSCVCVSINHISLQLLTSI